METNFSNATSPTLDSHVLDRLPEDGEWPYFSADEISAAMNVLRSGRVNYWTGSEGHFFEAEFAKYCGCSHAVAVANGTVALELALVALRLSPNDEVVTTPRSYFATSSAIVQRGLCPVFADVDAESQNITAETIEPVLSKRTRAILVVHLGGWPADMPRILNLARRTGLFVIEDCAQAHGALVGTQMVGSFGHVNAFSFCQDKIMSTGGEGGIVTTSDEELWRRCWEYKDHGKSFSAVYHRDHEPGFRWLHESFGTNWRLTEMQSAIGRVQLRKLGGWLMSRKRNATILTRGLSGLEALRVPCPNADISHAWYKWYGFLRPEALKTGWSRDRIMSEIMRRGAKCFTGGCPEIYREEAFVRRNTNVATFLPVARSLGNTSLMLLTHPTLSESSMHRTVEVAREVIQLATR